MRNIRVIAKRELAAYFSSPVAYVFLVIFLLLTGFFTFTAGQFFERGEASLAAFFGWRPALLAAGAVGLVIAAELGALGVDFSFTPVLDLDYGSCSVIGHRAFHFDPIAVGALGSALVAGLAEGLGLRSKPLKLWCKVTDGGPDAARATLEARLQDRIRKALAPASRPAVVATA